jgi:hypothetical protein
MLNLSYFYQKVVGAITTLALITTVCFTPPRVEAVDCCYQDSCDECCEEPCGGLGWGKTALILGGAAVVGGVAGALAGRAAGGHDGDSGPIGPTGPVGPAGLAPFVADVGQVLTFTFDFAVAAAVLGSLVITPFVATPDGRVFEAAPFTVTLLGAQPPIQIVVPDPVFGAYTVGFQANNTSLVAAGISLNTIVTASRDGSNTVLFPPITGAVIIPGQSQTAQEFVYGAPPIP